MRIPPTLGGAVWEGSEEYPSRVAGAVVRIGDRADTTGGDGIYRLSDLEPGPATLYVSATGYEDVEVAVTIPPAGFTARSVRLTWLELYEAGDFTAYVPHWSATWPVLVALGGPDTRGFAAGTPFGAPVPEVEASLQALGEELRAEARARSFTVLGTSRASLADGPESDALILDALRQIAVKTGSHMRGNEPLLLYGISGGAPQASGFAARQPGRVLGLFLKVPAGMESLAGGKPPVGGDHFEFPAYIVQAEMDAFADNEATADVYRTNRSLGAPWALALEPGVPHHSLSPAQRALTINWLSTIVSLRARFDPPFQPIIESDGWLGDPTTLEAVPFGEYRGDPRGASWFPTQATAEEWEAFVRGGPSQ